MFIDPLTSPINRPPGVTLGEGRAFITNFMCSKNLHTYFSLSCVHPNSHIFPFLCLGSKPLDFNSQQFFHLYIVKVCLQKFSFPPKLWERRTLERERLERKVREGGTILPVCWKLAWLGLKKNWKLESFYIKSKNWSASRWNQLIYWFSFINFWYLNWNMVCSSGLANQFASIKFEI
jgi:hypothetical protein